MKLVSSTQNAVCMLGGHCGGLGGASSSQLPSNLGSGSWCERNLQRGAFLWELSLGCRRAGQWEGAGLQVQLAEEGSPSRCDNWRKWGLTIAAVILKQRERQSLESSCQLALLPLTAWEEGPSLPPHFLVSLVLGLWHKAGWPISLSL